MTDPILQMTNVGRIFGAGETQVNALLNINLTVHPGELVAVMGPSGCGKSTLLNIAGGLDEASSGLVTLRGQDLARLSLNELADARRRTVGFVFQEYNLVAALTVEENVALPLELDGERVAYARAAARTALAEIGLANIGKRFPSTLSGGQQQRVAIARAIVGERALILADEPTGALDTTSGEEVLNAIRQRVDHGAAGLLVTHNSRQAAWADRVVFMRDGRIVDSADGDDDTPVALHEVL